MFCRTLVGLRFKSSLVHDIVLQVLDVVCNKPFKDHMRRLYTDWLLEENHALTPSGKIKKPSASTLGQWVITAWDGVSSESIVKGFTKCCVSNAMDGSQDDVLWDDSDDDADYDPLDVDDDDSSNKESDSDAYTVVDSDEEGESD